MSLEIIGIDEVGYGCIAGPLYICSLKFLKEPDFKLLDSKVISEKKRLLFFEKIQKISYFQIGIANVEEIVNFGLAEAYKLALNRSLNGMKGKIFIDGNTKRGLKCTAVIKGDKLIPQISAASIIAKVLRDKYMEEQSIIYPEYYFNKNKGYGTKLHIKAIKDYGPCPLHRTNYFMFI